MFFFAALKNKHMFPNFFFGSHPETKPFFRYSGVGSSENQVGSLEPISFASKFFFANLLPSSVFVDARKPCMPHLPC